MEVLEFSVLAIVFILVLAVVFSLGVTVGFIYYRGQVTASQSPNGITYPIFRGKAKDRKRPKFVSEEEQWQREQKTPPLDPGVG